MTGRLSQKKIRNFILEHQDDDPVKLLLSASRYPDIPMKAVAGQIKARQKAKKKLPTWHNNTNIIFPSTLAMEQCSSEATAGLKSTWVRGEILMDLTGGTGIDTYFLSKKFKETLFIEQDARLCELAKHNFQQFDDCNIRIINRDAAKYINDTAIKAIKADCVYIDPARRDQQNIKLFKLSDCQPDVTQLLEKLFGLTNTILIKTSPLLDIRAAVAALKAVCQVNIVAVNNDVKEVVYLLQKGYMGDYDIRTFNLLGSPQKQVFSFASREESIAELSFSIPLSYLYEPNNAVLKSGGFKIVGKRFSLLKLHPNSHLYTSENIISDFPGRRFIIDAICKLNKKEIKSKIPEGKANITTRNFPLPVDKIYQKLKLKPGGKHYLFATTDLDGNHIVVVCSKID